VSDGVATEHTHPCYDCRTVYSCSRIHSYAGEGAERGSRCCAECRDWAVVTLERLEAKRRKRMVYRW